MSKRAPRSEPRRAAHNGPPLGPKWKITDHAIEQYRARVEPECRSHGEAWHRLLTLLVDATRPVCDLKRLREVKQ